MTARWLVPSLGSILGLTALVNALLFRGARLFAGDGDVGRHIRVGRTVLGGTIPRVDLFSHTRTGAPFVPYEWLSEAVTALADAWMGLPGVALLSALLYVVAVFGVYRTADELGAPRMLAFPVALLALLLQSVHLLPRPHLFTTALAAVFMVQLVRFARSGRPWDLAPLPILMLVWANAHGGFLIGLILVGGFLGGALIRSSEFTHPAQAVSALSITLGLCAVASLFNPDGPALWTHTTGYLGIEYLVDATQEYRSVDFHEGYGKMFFVVLFAGPALWMTARVRVSRMAAGFYLLFAAAALHSARNIPLFTVIALPWLAPWLRAALQTRRPDLVERLGAWDRLDRRLTPGLATVATLGLLWYAATVHAGLYRFDPGVFPVNALGELGTDLPPGYVFNQMDWGGYLLYVRDDVPVFIDGQTDFYGEEVSREYLTVLKAGPGWREVLEARNVGWTLTRAEEPVNQLLELSAEWTLHFSDGVATIYRREPQ